MFAVHALVFDKKNPSRYHFNKLMQKEFSNRKKEIYLHDQIGASSNHSFNHVAFCFFS